MVLSVENCFLNTLSPSLWLTVCVCVSVVWLLSCRWCTCSYTRWRELPSRHRTRAKLVCSHTGNRWTTVSSSRLHVNSSPSHQSSCKWCDVCSVFFFFTIMVKSYCCLIWEQLADIGLSWLTWCSGTCRSVLSLILWKLLNIYLTDLNYSWFPHHPF